MKQKLKFLCLFAGVGLGLAAFCAQNSAHAIDLVALYDAGFSTNGAAPDPATPAGGNWWVTNTSLGPGVITNNLSPDTLYTNFNSWRTLDSSNLAPAQTLYYTIYPTDQQFTNSYWNGFKVSVRLRMLDPVALNAGTIAAFLSYENTNNGIRFSTFWDINGSSNLVMAPQAVAVAQQSVVATAASGQATNFHNYEIVYDPATQTADYKADGVALTNRAFVLNFAPVSHGLQWGVQSTGGRGDAYWNLVKLENFDYAPIVVTLNPTNVTRKVSQSVTFNANFSGSATNIQWFKDGAPLGGGPLVGSSVFNRRSYTITNIVPGDAGSYQLGIADPVGGTNVFTTAGVLSVNSDTNPPVLVSVDGILTMRHLLVRFDEGLDSTSAQNPANYTFAGGAATVLSATAEFNTVRLKTTPLNPNTSYTLSISDIQDQSANSIIATNKTFTAPNLIPVVLYDAGSNAVVGTAPDPTSTNGGLWRVNNAPSGNTFANISPDFAGLNGWNLDDQSTGAGRIQYFYQFPQISHTNAFNNGWRLHTRARFLNDYNGVQTMHMQYCDPQGKRYVLFWDLAGLNVDLWLILNPNGSPANGGIQTNVTTGGVGATDYHDIDIVYNPVTGKGECYYNGDFLFGNWNGDASTAFSGPYIGSVSDPAQGSMNVNQFDFSVVNGTTPVFTEPATNLVVNPGDAVTLSRAYTGFLASAQWKRSGTNLTAGATQVTYFIGSASDASDGLYTFETHNSSTYVESAAINLVVRPTISIAKSGSDVVVTFTGSLQACDTVGGTYTNVAPAPTSPLILSNPVDAALFYRSVKP